MLLKNLTLFYTRLNHYDEIQSRFVQYSKTPTLTFFQSSCPKIQLLSSHLVPLLGDLELLCTYYGSTEKFTLVLH